MPSSATSRQAVETFGVNERDMPPGAIARVAKAVGFSIIRLYAHPPEVQRHLYLERDVSTRKERLLASGLGQALRLVRTATIQRKAWGVVVLRKPRADG